MRNRRISRVVSLVLILATLVIFLPSCRQGPTPTVEGAVLLDKPLVGADIVIYSMEGDRLFEKDTATSTSGAFYFQVPNLPASFFISASGGLYRGSLFEGHLMTGVQGFNDAESIAITPFSTLAAVYWNSHPGTQLTQSNKMVEQFFAIPGATDMSVTLLRSQISSQFDTASFMTQANKSGGFDSFINILNDELDQGKVHPFVPMANISAGEGFKNAANYVKDSLWSPLKDKLIEKIPGGGFIMGLFNAIFGGGGPSEMQQVMDKLDEQSKQLTAIQNQMADLKDALDKVSIQILNDDIKAEWQTSVSGIMDKMSYIDTKYRNFTELSQTKIKQGEPLPESKKKQLDSLRDEVMKGDMEVYLDQIHPRIVGGTGYNGLLHAWADKLILEGGTYQDIENVFTKLLINHVKGATLIVESFVASGDRDGAAKKLSHIADNITAQVTVFLNQVDRFAIASEKADMEQFLFRSDDFLTDADAFAQMVLSSMEEPYTEGSNSTLTIRVKYDPPVIMTLPAQPRGLSD